MVFRYLRGDLEGLDMAAGYPYGLEEFDDIFMDITPSYLSVFGMLALSGVAVND